MHSILPLGATSQYSAANGSPVFDREATFIHPNATVIGNVELGAETSVWPSAVVRGDGGGHVKIGSRTNVQDCACIHGGEPDFPVVIGDNVTIAHGAIVHGSTIEDNVCVAIGAIVLDGCHIEKNVIVGAGAVVPPGKRLESGFMYIGSPAKQARPLSEKELNWLTYNANLYVGLGQSILEPAPRIRAA